MHETAPHGQRKTEKSTYQMLSHGRLETPLHDVRTGHARREDEVCMPRAPLRVDEEEASNATYRAEQSLRLGTHRQKSRGLLETTRKRPRSTRERDDATFSSEEGAAH
jgi:hypothetical protein